MVSPIDRFISICWENTLKRQANSKDFIYVAGACELIKEFEDFLGTSKLVAASELSLLQKMAEQQPLLRLYKHEVLAFLLRLVRFDSFEKFLKQRASTTVTDLARLVDNYELFNKKDAMMDMAGKFPDSRKLYDENTTNFKSFRGTGNTREFKFSSDNTRSFLLRKTKDYEESTLQQRKIYELEESLRNLQKYTDSLEQKLKSPSDEDLRAKTESQEKRIRQLELLCLRYEKENTDSEQKKLLRELTVALNTQDALITELLNKLDLGGEEKLQSFLIGLPFIKQYYMYYRYQEENKNIGTWMLNGLALMMGFLLVSNIAKLFYYVSLSFSRESSQYLYEMGEDENLSFSWIQQISWLEYYIYCIREWLDT